MASFAARARDIAEEETVMRGPIPGWSEQPLVPLAEAVGSLPLDPAAVHMYLRTALYSVEGDDTLSQDEAAALYLYTCDWPLSAMLNAALRDKDRTTLKPYVPYLKLLVSALSKLPRAAVDPSSSLTERLLWQCAPLDLHDEYARKLTKTFVRWPVTVACMSRDQVVALGTTASAASNASSAGSMKKTLFAIHTRSVVNIAKYSASPEEQQLVVSCGTAFEVVHVRLARDDPTTVVVELREKECVLGGAPQRAAPVPLPRPSTVGAGAATPVGPAAVSAPRVVSPSESAQPAGLASPSPSSPTLGGTSMTKPTTSSVSPTPRSAFAPAAPKSPTDFTTRQTSTASGAPAASTNPFATAVPTPSGPPFHTPPGESPPKKGFVRVGSASQPQPADQPATFVARVAGQPGASQSMQRAAPSIGTSAAAPSAGTPAPASSTVSSATATTAETVLQTVSRARPPPAKAATLPQSVETVQTVARARPPPARRVMQPLAGSALTEEQLGVVRRELENIAKYPACRCATMDVEGFFDITYEHFARVLSNHATPQLQAVGYWALARCTSSEEPAKLPDGRQLTRQQLLLESVRCNPTYGRAYQALGVTLPAGENSVVLLDGRMLSKQQLYLEALRCDPKNANALVNLGVGCLGVNDTVALPNGKTLDKRQLFLEALRVEPKNSMALVNLSLTLAPAGSSGGNITNAESVAMPNGGTMTKTGLLVEAIRVDKTNPHAYYCLGTALPETGDTAIKLADGRRLSEPQLYLEALRLGLRTAAVYTSLGAALPAGETITLADGRSLGKRALFLEALECDPPHATAYANLSFCVGANEALAVPDGRRLHRVELALEAVRCDPRCAAGFYALACCTPGRGTITVPDGRTMQRRHLLLETLSLDPYHKAAKLALNTSTT